MRGRAPYGTLLRPAALGLLVMAGACESGVDRPAPGRDFFDPGGRYVQAGVSTRTDVRVPPLRASSLGSDSAGREAQLYRSRCGSCHDAPDPGMKSGQHWTFILPRMQQKTRRAGVMPMTDAEVDSIAALLRRHARR